jgi:hypothetical protein
MVSESLRDMLAAEMQLAPAVDVTILGPDEPSSTRRVNLFLYQVSENPFLRNQDWQVRPGNPTRLAPPPLSLNLSYLLTAYAPNDALTGNATSHAILGEAMRVLYEHPVIPPAHLVSGLDGAREEIRIVTMPVDFDEATRIWSTFAQPYRTSSPYQVSVVQLDPQPDKEQVLPKRVETIGVPDVQAPFQPPVVTTMKPAKAAAGSVLTFTGEHLTGWRADVLITDVPVVQALELTGDSFAATIPAASKPGFHPVKVAISGFFRRVFVVEVT